MINPPKMIAIVAMAKNRVIGRDGDLPWHLPGDLKFFKKTTTGNAILMGRKTWDSIGKPLPNRRSIVLSSKLESVPEGVDLIRSPENLSDLEIETDLFVIGGAEIYRLFLDQCDEILLTHVLGDHEGDTFFPEFESRFGEGELIESAEDYEVQRYQKR